MIPKTRPQIKLAQCFGAYVVSAVNTRFANGQKAIVVRDTRSGALHVSLAVSTGNGSPWVCVAHGYSWAELTRSNRGRGLNASL